jgi:aryl-alcohol dehydrogenase-like predicted oxidoreductase
MALNSYLTLGRSGLRVSPLCLGTMSFGEDFGWGASVETCNALMDRFIERGGNFIDTANTYTLGHAEKIIGDHLGRHPNKRHRMVIATKFCGTLFPEDPNGGGAGRKSLIAACEESLRRLQTDYIDLYWMHCMDLHTPIEETMRALDDLVRAGKVRYIGFSDTPAWKVTQAQLLAQGKGWAPIIALQIEYSLLERTVEGELIPMARELGLGVTPWSPLKSGVLSGKYTRDSAGRAPVERGPWMEGILNEKTYSVIDVLQSVARELDSNVANVALAWVLARPGVSSTIIGARALEQLDNSLGALELKLTPRQVAALDEASKPTLNFPYAFLQSAPVFMHGGLSINGIAAPPSPMVPKSDKDRW